MLLDFGMENREQVWEWSKRSSVEPFICHFTDLIDPVVEAGSKEVDAIPGGYETAMKALNVAFQAGRERVQSDELYNIDKKEIAF